MNARLVLFAVLMLAPSMACALLVPLEGYSEGDSTPDAGGREASSERDGSADASPIEDASGDGDGAVAKSLAYAALVKADRPLAYWRFEETTGATAKDEMGKYDGTYENGAAGAEGVAGSRGLFLSGATQAHVVVPSTAFTFPGNAAFSVESWISLVDLTDHHTFVSTEASNNPRKGWSLLTTPEKKINYQAWAPSDAGTSELRRIVGMQGEIESLVAESRFLHVVVTYDGSAARVYLNGVPVTNTVVQAPTEAGGVLYLGCRWTGTFLSGCFGDGVIDEVAIYDHPLSNAQVKAHFAAGAP